MSLFAIGDIAAYRASGRLAGVLGYFAPDQQPTDDYLLEVLQASEASVASQLKVLLEPTTIFPYEPTEDEITALAGKPYLEEPGYDYEPGFFESDRWGYLVTRQHPIISVEYVRFAYPDPQHSFYTIPNDWLRPDKKYGHLRFVPASSTFTAPLNAFIMQAMSAGSTIPSAIQVKYVAGIKDAKSDPHWADLMQVIYLQASTLILEGLLLPNSGSISADGLSQSISMDAEKNREVINTKLFGPKGSNGGLWTKIHGVGGTIAGVLA